MIVYYLIWFLFTVLLFVEICIIDKNGKYSSLKNGIVFIIWVVLVFLTGFKGNVGTDYGGYQSMYNRTFNEEYVFSVGAIEPLYWLWMRVSSLLALPFAIFWLLTSVINLSLKFYVIRYISPIFSASILVYLVGLFFERDFDGIRQGLAISLCYIACIQYVKGKSYLSYIGIIFCAGLIHYTSLLFLLLPLLGKMQIKDNLIFATLVICVIGALFHWNIFEMLFSIIGHNNIMYDKIYSYTISEKYAAGTGLNVGGIFRIIILILFVKYKRLFHIDDRMYNLLKNGFFMAICFSLLFSSFDILSHRLAYGFREFQIFIIPFFIHAAKGLKNKLLVGGLISLYSLLLLIRLLASQPVETYSYRLIF